MDDFNCDTDLRTDYTECKLTPSAHMDDDINLKKSVEFW